MPAVPTTCDACGGINITLWKIKETVSTFHLRASWPFVYRCTECQAECGLVRDTTIPLGVMAGPRTRYARAQAHFALDKIWQGQSKISRGSVYQHLAARLNIPVDDCHIALFDEKRCNEVIEISKDLYKVLRRTKR